MLRLHHITVHHTCMLRESQTLTQVFIPIHNYSLAWLWYYHLCISKQSQGIKLLIVFNALSMIVFIIPILDAYHIRTNFITKVNYHAVLQDSQYNISESWEINNFYKIKPPPCSKRYKWSTRAKLSSSKDISEAHRVF